MNKDSKIFVAGHRGLVGSAIVEVLESQGYDNIIKKTSNNLDLRDQHAVTAFYNENMPEYVFLAAAKVGGIHANNTKPAEFIYNNLMIEANLIHGAYQAGVKKLLFLGSSCIYPKFTQQPIKEEALLTGALEPTNQWYAVAKIAGIKLCQAYREQYGCNFISVMPTNLYGPGDNFDLNNSHVLPALLRKFHEAKIGGRGQVTVWGSGTPKREFLYSLDCARACVHMMQEYNDTNIVNVGSGKDISIMELAQCIKDITRFEGEIIYDRSKPDGTPRKVLDTSRIGQLGWQPQTSLEDGIRQTYRWYLENKP
jgi:GDP-L-fucose synthase